MNSPAFVIVCLALSIAVWRNSDCAEVPTTQSQLVLAQQNEQLRTATFASLAKPKEGRLLLKKFMETHPGSKRLPSARSRFIGTYIQEDRPDDALTALQDFTELDRRYPDHSLELVRIAKSFVRLHRTSEAVGVLKASLKQSPNNANVHMALGEIYTIEDHEQAVAAYECAAKLNHQPAVRRLAEHFTSRKDWMQASEYWRKWKPASTMCGTCNRAMRLYRFRKLFDCYLQLEKFTKAQALIESVKPGNFDYSPKQVAVMRVDLHARRNQLNELKRRLEISTEASVATRATSQLTQMHRITAKYVQLVEYRNQRDFHTLWKLLRTNLPRRWHLRDMLSGYHPWQVSCTVRLLATEEAKSFLIQKSQSADPTHRIALLILARMQAADTIDLLKQRIRNRLQDQQFIVDYFYLAAQVANCSDAEHLIKRLTDDQLIADQHRNTAIRAIRLAKQYPVIN